MSRFYPVSRSMWKKWDTYFYQVFMPLASFSRSFKFERIYTSCILSFYNPGQNLLRQNWKSSKFQKWLNFLNWKFTPLPRCINVEPGKVLLPKSWDFANNIDLGGGGIFCWKINFLFCLNSFVQDCRIKQLNIRCEKQFFVWLLCNINF